MLIVDTHCDTLTLMTGKDSSLYKNNGHVDIERMKRIGDYVRFFSICTGRTYGHAYSLKNAIHFIDKFYQQAELYNDSIMLCCDCSEIIMALNRKKVAALLSLEGGEPLLGDLAALRIFYRLGVRSICLTWNYRNEIADGVSDAAAGGGLTLFGREVVKEMNTLGMIVDVSHLAEKGFWDVLELSGSPVIASHSNAKTICPHIRNLTDDQIIAVKKNGGVIGLNFYPVFLNDSGKAAITDIIKHIEHIAGLTGYDHIGIGSDFDGIETTPEGISGVQDMEAVFNELLKLNYPQVFVENFAGKNFMRIIEEVL